VGSLTRKNQNGAHNSFVDAKTQMNIDTHPDFIICINMSHAIHPIAEKMFSKSEQYYMSKRREPPWEVNKP
jgi:hypothetical protein